MTINVSPPTQGILQTYHPTHLQSTTMQMYALDKSALPVTLTPFSLSQEQKHPAGKTTQETCMFHACFCKFHACFTMHVSCMCHIQCTCVFHVPWHAWNMHGTCMEHVRNWDVFHACDMHATWMAFMPWMYHAWSMHAWSGCWKSILLCSSFLYRSLHVRSTSWKLY